jgi:hypothetical protein
VDKHIKDSARREQIIRQRDRNRAAQQPTNVTTSSNASGSPASKGLALPDTDRSATLHKQKRGILPNPPTSLPPKPVLQLAKKGELPNDIDTVVAQRKADTRSPPTGPRAMREGIDTVMVEDQKRMELLARKAAMDSITRKRAAKSSPYPISDDPGLPSAQSHGLEIEDVDSAVDALLAAVRLNSVSSEQPNDSWEKEQYDEDQSGDSESSAGEPLPDYDSDAMVEDELDARSPSFSDAGDVAALDPTSVFGSKRHLSPGRMSPDAPAFVPSPQLPPAIPNARVRFEALDTSPPPQPSIVAVPVAARKSRPIASDFIDQTPPRSIVASTNELDRNAPLKRKRSFVDPQVWPRRLVIDLDSSDEEDEDEVEGGIRNATSGTSASSSRGSVERNTSSGGNGKPANEGGRDLAAQMLLEKELQIKAMMQKIKMREMKKKMTGSGSGTPVLAAASIVLVPEGVVASVLPPRPVVTPPSAVPSDVGTAAMEAMRQETATGITSTLEMQRGRCFICFLNM